MKKSSNVKSTQTDIEDHESISEGLGILINCLNDIIDSTGKRDRLTSQNKRKIVDAFLKARTLMPKEILHGKLRISPKTISLWAAQRPCDTSLIKLCFQTNPQQLSASEQDLIKRKLFDPENSNLPRNHIWAKARREGLLISNGSFYRYAAMFAGNVAMEKQTTNYPNHQIIAKRPFQILHMDSTLIRCLNGERVYVHFIIDNYSRKVLGAIPAYSSKSELIANNLHNVIVRHKLYRRSIELYCDDGPENKGYIKDLLKREKRIKITRIVHGFRGYNNLIEHWNNRFKNIVLKKFHPEDFQNLDALLPLMIDYSNNLHLPILKTLTPNEVVKGKKHKDLNYIKLMKMSRDKRIEENLNVDCRRLCPKVNFIDNGTMNTRNRRRQVR